MNRDKREEESYTGKQAETLVTNPAYQAAWVRLRAKYFEQFGETGIFQKRKRESLWLKIQMVNDFEQELTQMLYDGHLADQDLNDEKRLKSVSN